jgi:hypothetical protein
MGSIVCDRTQGKCVLVQDAKCMTSELLLSVDCASGHCGTDRCGLRRVQDNKPLFVLSLLTCELIETVDEDDKKKKGQHIKCAFELRPTDEGKKQEDTHILKADTEQWYSQWIEAIRNGRAEAVALDEERRRKKGDRMCSTRFQQSIHYVTGVLIVNHTMLHAAAQPLVFGRPLAESVSVTDGSELPVLFTQAISYLEGHSMLANAFDNV